MPNQIDAGRSRRRMRLLTGVPVALSLLFVTAVEGSHTHGGAGDTPAACSICHLSHQAGPVISSATPNLAGRVIVRAPALPGLRLSPGIVHRSSHRSRAPPLPISLQQVL